MAQAVHPKLHSKVVILSESARADAAEESAVPEHLLGRYPMGQFDLETEAALAQLILVNHRAHFGCRNARVPECGKETDG
jgi:hypothetical protein